MKHSLKYSIGLIGMVAVAITANATDLVWIGGTGNWNLAGNWNPAQVPTAADNVWITNSGTYTVTVPAGSTTTANSVNLGGASGTQTLALDRGTLTIAAASTVNANGVLSLLVSQSELTGSGSLTVNGMLNWANGTISGAGALSIGSTGILSIGNGGVTLGRILNNSGTATWTGGNLTFATGATLNNLSGAAFDITADGRLSGSAATPINNSGLFRQTAGIAGTTVIAPFNNSASVRVLASTLSLDLGGTQSGVISNAPGATLNLGGGNHVLTSGSLVTGAGVLSMSGNATTLSANGVFDPGSALSVTAGTVTLSASCNVTATLLNLSGNGVVNYNSAGPVAAVNLTGGTLGGTSPVSVTGPLTLSGGTVTNALVTANGGLNISGNTTLNGTRLVNPTNALWSAGNIIGSNGAVFSNLLGATFINNFDGNFNSGAGATPVFFNDGVFQKTNGTAALGTTSIDFQFINTGTVEVRTNTLRYAVNQQTAGLTLLDGGNLTAQAQPLQLLGGSLVGTGLVTVANVQNVINSGSISPGLPLGRLDISGNYQQTASGALNIELGGYSQGTNFDFITVAAGGAGGNATLAGTLNVSLANGFAPTNGASFTFLQANSRAGAFATFNYPSNEIGMQASYDVTSAIVKVTNLKPVISVPIADPAAVTYGTSFNFQFPANTFSDPDNDSLTYTASGMPPGVTFSGATRTFSGSPGQAGVFAVAAIATDSGAPSLSVTNTFNITVTPATLTVTADPQTKAYGTGDPALTYSVSGLQFSDTASGVVTGVLARVSGESVAGSPYPITQGTLSANGNYAIDFIANSFIITSIPLSIGAIAQTKIYGTADPALTVNYSGLVNGETPAVLGGLLGFIRAPGENVGGYAITPGGLTSSNYTITFDPGTLSITPAALSVAADAKIKSYGGTDPALTFAVSGLQFSDTAATVLTGALTRAAGESVAGSPYSITKGTLAANGNYAINFTSNTLAITPASLSVNAEAKTKVYGNADPAFTATYSGFAFGETPAALSGSVSFNRAAGENVGNYAITPGGVSNSNYAITFSTAALTITPAALSITANSATRLFGTPDPAFTASITGLVNGDTAATLSGTLNFTRAPGEAPGNYAITPGGLASGNYTINFNPGTLSITAPAPTVFSPLFTSSNVVITWTAFSNATYRVQFNSNLNAATWTDLDGDVVAGASTASKTDVLTTNRFYRIQVVQP